MGRAPCCDKNGLKKGPWTPEEDQKLIDYIQKHGHGSWRTLPKNAGLSRCGKSCRLRWTNYLRPDIKRGRFSFEEEETIIQLHSILGNKWSAIAARLPGRTDNEIKNYWNTHIRKRLLRMGIDPVTHTPRLDLLDLSTLLANPTMYNPAQLDISGLLGVDPLVNSELLRIASTLFSSQCQDSTSQLLHPQSLQEANFTNNFNSFNQVQEVPVCTSSNSTPLFMQSNVNQFQPTDVSQAQNNMWGSNGMGCNFSENFALEKLEQYSELPQFVSSDNSNVYFPNNQNYAMTTSGVSSTPVSSPADQLNSASTTTTTYLNSSTEDERDSYCSELFKFHIPDLLDVSDFL